MFPKIQNRLAGLIIALMLPSAGAQAPGSIEGTVVAVGSSAPVPRATVTLTTTGGRQVAILTTAIDGRFAVSNVAPGEYRIAATLDGFVRNSRGSLVSVVSGKRTDVTVSITPDGAISGRVVDWDGLPVVRSSVQALTFTQDGQGQRLLIVSGSDQTNDLGEYRIYWLPPGPYFLRATPASVAESSASSINVEAIRSVERTPSLLKNYAPTFFSGSVNVSEARKIDVRAAETITGADIRLIDVRQQRVSGTVSILSSRGSTEVRLTAGNPAAGLGDFRATTADRSGAFRFDNVIPGSYILTAEATNTDGEKFFGRMPIEVVNRDVENLSVILNPGFDLRIRLTIEGRSRQSDDPQLVVNLRPAIPSTPFPTVERNGEDELTMHRVMQGNYSVAVLSLTNARNQIGTPSNGSLYLKSAQFGSADVLTVGLHIEGPTSGVLDIVMADGAGTLSGSVLDDRKQAAFGVTVVLVPEPRLRGRRDLYKTATADTAGKFEISGITPGQYKAFSWEAVGQGSWEYSDFIELYEDRGQPVRIDGGRRDAISVQLIPARY